MVIGQMPCTRTQATPSSGSGLTVTVLVPHSAFNVHLTVAAWTLSGRRMAIGHMPRTKAPATVQAQDRFAFALLSEIFEPSLVFSNCI